MHFEHDIRSPQDDWLEKRFDETPICPDCGNLMDWTGDWNEGSRGGINMQEKYLCTDSNCGCCLERTELFWVDDGFSGPGPLPRPRRTAPAAAPTPMEPSRSGADTRYRSAHLRIRRTRAAAEVSPDRVATMVRMSGGLRGQAIGPARACGNRPGCLRSIPLAAYRRCRHHRSLGVRRSGQRRPGRPSGTLRVSKKPGGDRRRECRRLPGGHEPTLRPVRASGARGAAPGGLMLGRDDFTGT